MTLKGIICDFGGVLVLPGSSEFRQQWADRFHLSLPEFMDELFQSPIALKSLRGQISEQEMWKDIQNKFKLDDSDLGRLRRDIFRNDVINLELVNFVKILPDLIKKAILSNAWLGTRKVITDKYQLQRTFELIVISAEEGLSKPDGEIYLRTANRLELNPWELLFIDDMIENVMAATKIGMAAIHFKETRPTIDQVMTILKSHGAI